jgi:hypothetical protein
MTSTPIHEFQVTPTQDLILSVLAQGYRLGDTLIDFDNAFKRSAAGLVEQGLISTMHGSMQGTFRASLNDDGIGFQMSPKVIPPVFNKDRWSKERRKEWPKQVTKNIAAAKKRYKAKVKAAEKAADEQEAQSRAAAE